MSQTITCQRCGRLKDIPAYPGDGVYTTHHCDPDNDAVPVHNPNRIGDDPEEE